MTVYINEALIIVAAVQGRTVIHSLHGAHGFKLFESCPDRETEYSRVLWLPLREG